jgi:hypothetical protein
MEDIRHVLNTFSSISFNLISKSCNRPATLLAVEACNLVPPLVWHQDCPPTIQSIVNFESLES